jgi:hypothetical protein
MEKPKKNWETPKLIVLARGESEESVLTHCKTQNPSVYFDGPQDDTLQSDCAAGENFKNCSNCKSRAFGVS